MKSANLKRTDRAVARTAALAVLMAAGTHAQEALNVNPDEYLTGVLSSNRALLEQPQTGEGWVWRIYWHMPSFLLAYEIAGDARWLDVAGRFYDAVLDKAAEGPDGYRGWLGPHVHTQYPVWNDAQISDALIYATLLRFSEIVLVEQPETLKAAHGARAERYVAMARRNLFEKWERRGTIREDGPFATVVQWDHFAPAGDPARWVAMPKQSPANMSNPHNKTLYFGTAALRLHRITGEARYRALAERIFGGFKARLLRNGAHYVWNYWEPYGPWDLDSDKPNGLQHGVWTHPRQPAYQVSEMENVVQAYHYGVVFTEADIRAFLSTNLEVMWDGNRERPGFANSNVAADPDGRRPAAGQPSSGALWSALRDFSDTVRELEMAMPANLAHPRIQIDRAYALHRNATRPAGFGRRFVPDDTAIPPLYARLPIGGGDAVRLAVALPARLPSDGGTTLVWQTNRTTPIEIAVFDETGTQKLFDLHRGESVAGATRRLAFDGREPASGRRLAAGAYVVRWTTPKNGSRGFPIEVQ